MAWTTFDADTGSTGTNPVDNATWNGGFNSTGASTSVLPAPNSIVLRDSNGLSKIGTPVASQDIANKTYVDTVGTTSTPVGSVALFAGNAVPSGWFLCNGQALNRTTYSSLFGVLVPTLGTVTSITIAAPAVLTVVGHGLTSGDSIYLTTTGALPTGLTANTQLYYVTVLTVDTFNVSTTYANYIAGTKVATTVAGSGVQTAWRCAFGLGDGTTTFNLPDLRLTAQGIPNATAAVGGWTSYTPTLITNLPGSWAYAQWRRVGSSINIQAHYIASGAATGTLSTTNLIPSGLTVGPVVPNSMYVQASVNGSIYGALWNFVNMYGLGTASVAWSTTQPNTWGSSSAIIFDFSVPIAQWTTNNNLLSYNIKS